MHYMNDYLATKPFDIYELNLFHLVADCGSFTKAGQMAGITQSAITRQIHGMEERLGITLFERTTRHVSLTAAGKLLRDKSRGILDQVASAINQLQQNFDLVPKTIRVGISRSIGLAYFPGFFFAFQKRHPDIQIQLAHQDSREILTQVENGDLNVGILCPPASLARSVQITHRFQDGFTIIVPPHFNLPAGLKKVDVKRLAKLLAGQRWLLINRESNTGNRLQDWLLRQGLRIKPAMEMDSFDLIVNLVAMGMGVSVVPHRALALYAQRRLVQRIRLKQTFSRELVVVIRKNRKPPVEISQFVENILY
jgi:DNA-binding transcriptional LysR family regulator